MFVLALWLLLFVSMAPLDGLAAPADLDPGFPQAATHDVRTGAAYLHVNALPGGRVLAASPQALARFDAAGRLDARYGNGGVVAIEDACTPLAGATCRVDGVAFDGAGTTYIGVTLHRQVGSPPDDEWHAAVLRVDATGRADAAFAARSLASLTPSGVRFLFLSALHVRPDGKLVVFGPVLDARQSWLAVAALRADGRLDDLTPTVRVTAIAVDANHVTATPTPDAGAVVLARRPWTGERLGEPLLVRFTPDLWPDTTFATAEWVLTNPAGHGRVAVDARGRILVAQASGQFPVLTVQRFTPEGALDPTFGRQGAAAVEVAGNDGTTVELAAMSVDDRGRIVLAGSLKTPVPGLFPPQGYGSQYGFSQGVLARLRDDGTPDLTFGGGASGSFFVGFGATARALAAGSDGALWIAGTREFVPEPPRTTDPLDGWRAIYRSALYRVLGGEGAPRRVEREAWAIEYFHADFGHYFTTADPVEAATLDAGLTARHWQRTGRVHRVWTQPGAALSATCRFFSGATFAPRSSHFYAADPAECAKVAASGHWTGEGTAFHVALPADAAIVACPPGTVPLYRLYNNGLGGAPNHRYTTDDALVDRMIASGWTFEGDADTRIYACVPPR